VGRPKDELARQLRLSLMQRVYLESWQALESCEEVGSDKHVEKSRKKQRSLVVKDIKMSSHLKT